MTDDTTDTDDRIEKLEEQNEQLRERVAELEEAIDDQEARMEAFNRARLHLNEETSEHAGRLAELERVVEPDPGRTGYDQLTKAQKIHRVRKKLVETAARANGRAALKYKEVKMLFDGHPSPGHCYDLMERAADLDGFAYDKAGGGDGQKRIRVKMDAVKDETLVHAANKASGGGGV